MSVEAAGGLRPFQTIMYTTKDGEHCTATKKDDVVTVVGDKNGTRLLELEDFMKNELFNNVQNINLENSPEKDEGSFKSSARRNSKYGKTDIDKGDYIERHIVAEGTKSRKAGVGIASAIFPGLGQFINGDAGKGFGFLAATVLSPILVLPAVLTKKPAIRILCASLAILPQIGARIWAPIDAVKNAKTEITQIIDK